MDDPRPKPRALPKHVGAGAVVFAVLTIAVFAYQFARIDAPAGAPPVRMQWRYALLIALALPIEPIATSARLWLVCRVLAPQVRLWDCFKADAANLGLSVLTPSQSGGGPAQIYLLARAGADVGAALTASLLSFLGTLVGLLIIGVCSLACADLGDGAGILFSAAIWTITICVGVMLLAALVPNALRAVVFRCSRGRLARRAVAVVYAYRRHVVRFLREGKLAFAGVVAATLVFLLSRALMGYLAVRLFGIGADFAEVIGIQLALLFIIYFAPTPGGAGIAEAASLAAMAAVVSPEIAPYYNLVWRFSTVYLVAIAGILFTLRALADDAAGRRTAPRATAAPRHHRRPQPDSRP